MRGRIMQVEHAGDQGDFWGRQEGFEGHSGEFALLQSRVSEGYYMLFIGDEPVVLNGQRREDYLRTTPGKVTLEGKTLRLTTGNTRYTIQLYSEPPLELQLAEARCRLAELKGEAAPKKDPGLTALLP